MMCMQKRICGPDREGGGCAVLGQGTDVAECGVGEEV